MMVRTQIDRTKLALPPAATPRPGDKVIWFADAQRKTGKYLGHGIKSRPIVLSDFGSRTKLSSFDCIRIENLKKRKGPNWKYLPKECLLYPTSEEREKFDSILDKRIPPGPKYIELIEEIWHRGYEIYVVGGTVRDVVSGADSNDVDIVTTMPLNKFRFLLSSMFKRNISIREPNGFARLGGNGNEGDPFIDLKSFCHCDTGTQDALFGADFSLDLQLRDFACNSIYYDPINKSLIDPSLKGLADAKNKTLTLVCNPLSRPPEALGQIAIRYFKFKMRGFSGDKNSDQLLLEKFIPCISSMTSTQRLSYIKRQILGKIPAARHREALERLENEIINSCGRKTWEDLFSPIITY